MHEHESRLRSALEYVGAGTQAESRLDVFAVPQRHRRPALLAATAGFLLVLTLAVPLALRDGDSPSDVGGQAPVTTLSPVTPQPLGTTQPEPPIESTVTSAPPVGLEINVSAAVAPFDHESFVDSLLLEFSLARIRNQQVFDCIAAAGFVPPTTSALPSRDDPILMSAAFPDVDTLARDGFPNLPGTSGSLDSADTRSEAEAAASRACAEQVDGSQTDVIEAMGLFGSMRSAWEGVLAEIDALEAIHALVDDFGVCLREEGIPAEFTMSEGHYLGYVDSLLVATGSDESTWPEIRERTGRLYAECGQDLFTARTALRSGERREAFLSQYEDSIDRLSELVLGIDQPPADR